MATPNKHTHICLNCDQEYFCTYGAFCAGRTYDWCPKPECYDAWDAWCEHQEAIETEECRRAELDGITVNGVHAYDWLNSNDYE